MGEEKIQEVKEQGQWEKNHTIVVEDSDMEALLKELEGKQKRLVWIIDRLDKNLKPM